jgi:hypothetical protein
VGEAGAGDLVAEGVRDAFDQPVLAQAAQVVVHLPGVMDSAGTPRNCARMGRRSRLAKPREKMAMARGAQTAGHVRRRLQYLRDRDPEQPGAQAPIPMSAATSAHQWCDSKGTRRQTLILHWNGTAWTRTPSPAARRNAILAGLSGPSARNAWAAGATIGPPAAAIGRAGYLSAVTALARAAGTAPSAPPFSPLILHWNGSA